MKMSKAEAAIRLALAFYEAANRHDIAGILTLMSAGAVVESNGPAPDGAVLRGKEEIVSYWRGLFAEKQQLAMELEEVYGLGKRCVGRWTCSWTDEAGERAHMRGVDLFRVNDDAIQEILSYVKG